MIGKIFQISGIGLSVGVVSFFGLEFEFFAAKFKFYFRKKTTKMQDNKDKPKETDKKNPEKNADKLSENKEFIESILDRPEPKKKEQDFTRDYAITLNLGQDLEKKYKALELESKGKSEEELVNIRLRQLGLAKLLVKIHGRDAQILIKSNTHVGHAYLEYKCYEQSYNHLMQA
jgi:hypothetical protein